MSEFCLITKTVPLSDFTQFYVRENEIQDNEGSTDSTFGGILSNTKYAWYANGPRFQVIDLKRGRMIAGWCFGSVVKDSSTKVVCVAEIPTLSRDSPVLLVGLEYALTGGTVCIFDVSSSKVLRAIQLREKVSSLHVIDEGKGLLPLDGPLRSFDGVVGVGCIGGDVLLVDLCQHSIEEEGDRDEVDACQVVTLTCKDLPNLEHHKQRLQKGVHLAICLNESGGRMSNRRSSPGIVITSLRYCPQLGSLLVGYSFGAWQIWELFGMTLVYTSPTYDKNVPISHFTLQEPADDPKPVCYIWVVYSHKEAYPSFPLAVLYSANYGIKEFHDGYGVLYQDFETCMVRYQMELASQSQNTSMTSREAYCLRLTSCNKSNSNRIGLIENHEEVLSLCCLVWNVHGAAGVETYLSLFDLNQWYKAQMPSSNDEDSENYMSVICITDVIGNKSSLLDIAIDENSLKQFLGVQKPEEHYYPTALSFDICCCEEKIVNFLHHQGEQRSLLNNLEKTESLIFLKPLEVCQTALQLGLTPLFFDSSINSITSQREFLLSLALEQQMTGWLSKCVSIWSNGRFKSSGCTLEFFLEWAWNRAVILKTNVDALSTPLFDYSESIIDANNQRIMNVCINQLLNIRMIYKYVFKRLEQFLLHKDIVQQQCNSLQMVVAHLQVLQWLVNIGLLPETGKSYSYPIDSLLPYYAKRRSEIQDAYKQRFSSNENLLFIDNLLKHEFSDTTLQEHWKEDDGDGLYPPPSMQSLLRTYLIDNVSLTTKHIVTIYAFLDLAMALDRDRHTFIITQLIKFPTIFRLSPSVIRLTQAFWHLDHGDFGPALERLLDPLITTGDLKIWHHRTVFNSFLIQGQHNLALTYYQIRKPHLKDDDDVVKILSLFIENNMIHEAMDFQRKHVTAENQTRILTHLYRECNSTKQLKKLLHCALSEQEEQILMKYLRDVSHPNQEKLEIMYYLQRFRYMDILQMSDHQKAAVPSGLLGQKSRPFTQAFVKTLSGLFPKVARDLFQACQNQKNMLGNRVISRPRPMSVVVHNAEEQAKYKSTLIQIGIMKAREIWNKPIESSCAVDATVENLPFMRTPITPSSKQRKRPSVVCPKIIKVNEKGEEDIGESPCKQRKLSPRESIGALSTRRSLVDTSLNISLSKITKLDTPVIKRVSRRLSGQDTPIDNTATTCTPQSILKVRNLIASHSLLQEDVIATSLKASSSTEAPGLKLTPRKSLSRLTVHFEKSANIPSSSESSEQVSRVLNLSSILAPEEAPNERVQESSDTTEEIYYSPQSSLEELNKNETSDADKTKDMLTKQSFVTPERKSSPVRDTLQIKGRSSYKDQSSAEKPVKKSTPATKEIPTISVQSPPAVSSPNQSGRPKSRKSLSRMVLENNALSTLSPTTRRSARLSLSSPKLKPLSSILGDDDVAAVSNQNSEECEVSVKVHPVEEEENAMECSPAGQVKEISIAEPEVKNEEAECSPPVKSPYTSKQILKRRRSLRRLTVDTKSVQSPIKSIRSFLPRISGIDESILIDISSGIQDPSSWFDDSIFNTDNSSVVDEKPEEKDDSSEETEKSPKIEPAEMGTSTPFKGHASFQLIEQQTIKEENISIKKVSNVSTRDEKIKSTVAAMLNTESVSNLISIDENFSGMYMSSLPESLFASSVDESFEAQKLNQQGLRVASKCNEEKQDVTRDIERDVSEIPEGNEGIADNRAEEENIENAEEREASTKERTPNRAEDSSTEVFEECINAEEEIVFLNEFEINIADTETLGATIELSSQNYPETDAKIISSDIDQVFEHATVQSQRDLPQPETLQNNEPSSQLQKSNSTEETNFMERAFILSTDVIEITNSSEESFCSKYSSEDAYELDKAFLESIEFEEKSNNSSYKSSSQHSVECTLEQHSSDAGNIQTVNEAGGNTIQLCVSEDPEETILEEAESLGNESSQEEHAEEKLEAGCVESFMTLEILEETEAAVDQPDVEKPFEEGLDMKDVEIQVTILAEKDSAKEYALNQPIVLEETKTTVDPSNVEESYKEQSDTKDVEIQVTILAGKDTVKEDILVQPIILDEPETFEEGSDMKDVEIQVTMLAEKVMVKEDKLAQPIVLEETETAEDQPNLEESFEEKPETKDIGIQVTTLAKKITFKQDTFTQPIVLEETETTIDQSNVEEEPDTKDVEIQVTILTEKVMVKEDTLLQPIVLQETETTIDQSNVDEEPDTKDVEIQVTILTEKVMVKEDTLGQPIVLEETETTIDQSNVEEEPDTKDVEIQVTILTEKVIVKEDTLGQPMILEETETAIDQANVEEAFEEEPDTKDVEIQVTILAGKDTAKKDTLTVKGEMEPFLTLLVSPLSEEHSLDFSMVESADKEAAEHGLIAAVAENIVSKEREQNEDQTEQILHDDFEGFEEQKALGGELEITTEETRSHEAEIYQADISKVEDVFEQTPTSSKQKILRPVAYDMFRTHTKRMGHGASTSEATPKIEEIGNENVSRTLRSASADPETPRRKSRRLSGAGLADVKPETIESPSVATRRRSGKIEGEVRVDTSKSKMPQRRTKRAASTSDCKTINVQEQEVRTPGRIKRTISAAGLPAISEEGTKGNRTKRSEQDTKQADLGTEEQQTSTMKGRTKIVEKEDHEKPKRGERSKVITSKNAERKIMGGVIEGEQGDKKEGYLVKSNETYEKTTKGRKKLQDTGQTKHDEDCEVEKSFRRAKESKKSLEEEEQNEYKDNEMEPLDYPTSRRITRTQKNILAKVQSSRPEAEEELHTEITPPRAAVGPSGSRMMTRTRSTDSVSSVSSSINQDTGRTTRSSLRRKPSEESLASIEQSPSISRKRTRSASQKSDVVSDVESENSVPSVRRSTRSRSKTPDISEKSTKILRKGYLEEIPEDPETSPEEPKNKKGRSKKSSAT